MTHIRKYDIICEYDFSYNNYSFVTFTDKTITNIVLSSQWKHLKQRNDRYLQCSAG